MDDRPDTPRSVFHLACWNRPRVPLGIQGTHICLHVLNIAYLFFLEWRRARIKCTHGCSDAENAALCFPRLDYAIHVGHARFVASLICIHFAFVIGSILLSSPIMVSIFPRSSAYRSTHKPNRILLFKVSILWDHDGLSPSSGHSGRGLASTA